MLSRKQGGLVYEFYHVFVQKDFVLFACRLNLSVSHGAFQIEKTSWAAIVKQIFHEQQIQLDLDTCDRVLDDELKKSQHLCDHGG